MENDLQVQIDSLKKEVKILHDTIYGGKFSNLKAFNEKVLMRSDMGFVPSKNLAAFPNTYQNVWYYVGTAYDDTTIKSLVGTTNGAGSWYISTNSTTPGVWNLVGSTWTKLNIN